MYSSLIENIIESEHLIEIGKFGTASQSSLSKWSKENDAQRAVSGEEHQDFSFHTDIEMNPWWQIEFNTLVAVDYIIINNRKRSPFDTRASTLSIIAYDDDDNEKLLHSGEVYFGSKIRGCPLIIPLKSKVILKKLRIMLLKESYLHLSNIKFLVSDPLSSFGDKSVFIAQRGDGLGERLRALLNSMVLAKEFDGNFIFAWPPSFSKDEFHAIDKPDNIFSHDFIVSHLVTKHTLDKCEIKEIGDMESVMAHPYNGYKKIGINLGQLSLKNQIKNKGLHPKNLSLKYKLAFENINFNKGVTKSINLAKSVKLEKKVLGVHLRSGDIVYGQYRHMDRYYSKVVPFYVVKTLIKRYLDLGYEIVLFSQDDEACKYFKKKYGVLLSNDLIPEDYNDIQRAIFDMVLMSRCKEIVGGLSGFAIVASWIGDSKILNYKEILSEEEIKYSFIHSLNEDGVLTSSSTPPLLKSFSIAHYLQSFKYSSSIKERVKLLQKCVKIDDSNNYYRLLLALDYYKENNFSAADDLLLAAINSTYKNNIKWLAKTKFPKVTILSEYTLELEKHAMQGSVVAAYVAFLSRYYCDELEMNIDFYQNCIRELSKKKNTIGADLLKEIQQKLTLNIDGL